MRRTGKTPPPERAMEEAELDAWLQARRAKKPLATNASMFDGFVTAIAAGPTGADPFRWITALLAVPHSAFETGGTPEFAAIKAAADRFNVLGTDLREGRFSPRYGAVPVLTDISTSFAQGSFTSLLGPSGSGKTTLLRIVAGFIIPDKGNVTIGGNEVTNTPVWARNIGMVFQSYALFPHMTVNDNVAFGLHRRGIWGEEAHHQVKHALELVRMPQFGDRKPKELSGGQQQRVALARAIVTKPSVLLLDEPLSALDRRLRQEMQIELIRIQRESGLTTIFVTHDQEEALTLSDKVAILDRGRIIQIGAPMEVYERPRARFAAEFLGDTNFLNGTVVTGGLRLGNGSVMAVDAPLPAPGSKATVAVRPEKIAISDAARPLADQSRSNRVTATISSSVYAGTSLTYEAVFDGLSFKIFAQNSDARPHSPGDVVELAWSPAHTVPLEDSA